MSRVEERDRLRVVQRESAWPRAFFVDGITEYAAAADLVRQVAARGRPFAAIQSSDQRAIDAHARVDARPSGTVIPARQYTLTVNTTTFARAGAKRGRGRAGRNVSCRTIFTPP